MKTPKLLTTIFVNIKKRTATKLKAATAAARSGMDSYETDEPTTKLSSAFVVVLILHVVAIGGIYAFNSIKASRLSREPKPAAKEEGMKLSPKTTVKAPAISEATGPAATRIQPGPTVPSVPTVSPKTGLKQYLVKAGDNPTKIAFAYSVKTEELLAANNLKDGAVLHPGDTLTIPKSIAKPAAAEQRKAETTPAKRVDVAPTKTTPGVHIVKKRETATSIAKVYGLAAADLLKLNKISDPTKIRQGQTLTIPKKRE
jgi:LysM repeat protein